MILNRAERMLARRYLLPGKGEGFIFLVASISLVAVALGVAALIIVMSVMNGFRAELFDKIVGLNGHAIVQGYDGRLADWQQHCRRGEEDARRHLGDPADRNAADGDRQRPLRRRAGARHAGRGHPLQPDDQPNVVAGDLKSIVPGSNRVAIGSRLAETLGAYPGSQITLWNPEGRSTVVGTVPREVTYTVGADVRDRRLRLRQGVRGPADAGRAAIAADGRPGRDDRNPDQQSRTRSANPRAASRSCVQGRGVIVDWRQMNSALFQALEVERVAMFVVLSLIVLVAVFNILSSLIMLVRAKTRDIAILRTMGASRGGMMKVFMTVGVTIGSLGILLGMILGAIFLFFRQDVVDAIQTMTGQNLWDPSVRVLTDLPSQDRPVRGDGDRPHRAGPVVPGDALPRLQGGEHRPGAGAPL